MPNVFPTALGGPDASFRLLSNDSLKVQQSAQPTETSLLLVVLSKRSQ